MDLLDDLPLFVSICPQASSHKHIIEQHFNVGGLSYLPCPVWSTSWSTLYSSRRYLFSSNHTAVTTISSTICAPCGVMFKEAGWLAENKLMPLRWKVAIAFCEWPVTTRTLVWPIAFHLYSTPSCALKLCDLWLSTTLNNLPYYIEPDNTHRLNTPLLVGSTWWPLTVICVTPNECHSIPPITCGPLSLDAVMRVFFENDTSFGVSTEYCAPPYESRKLVFMVRRPVRVNFIIVWVVDWPVWRYFDWLAYATARCRFCM